MKELWVPISAAIAQQKNVETIANNVANANTPGFKREQLVFKEYLSAYEKGTDIDLPNKEWAPEDFYRTYGAEQAQVKVDGAFTEHSQGQMIPTGNPLDIALRGKGFVEVLTPAGIRFTRNGSLNLSQNGDLVTNAGHPVLSALTQEQLKSGQVPPPKLRVINIGMKGKLSVNLQGDIFNNNKNVAKLSVVEFKDVHAIKKEGHSLYLNNDYKNRVENVKTSVHQGFSEQSNVNAIAEMSALIKANRQFESIQKVIKAYDSMSQKGVNEIGRF